MLNSALSVGKLFPSGAKYTVALTLGRITVLTESENYVCKYAILDPVLFFKLLPRVFMHAGKSKRAMNSLIWPQETRAPLPTAASPRLNRRAEERKTPALGWLELF